MAKQKVVILGGGVASITAAYELTNAPDWNENYEVTIYQMGWRLGGKCASGRNSAFGDRIEEHGLHILCGFYENAFHTIRGCYEDLIKMGLRSPDAPNASWKQAFSPKDNVDLCEYIDGQWIPWTLIRSQNGRTPGDYSEGAPATPWQFVQRLISHVLKLYGDSPYAGDECDGDLQNAPGNHAAVWRNLSQRLENFAVSGAFVSACDVLQIAHKFASALPANSNQHDSDDHWHILWLLERFGEWLHRRISVDIEENTWARRLTIEIGLCYAVVRGILRDRVLDEGFSAIDHLDFKEWIANNLENWPGAPKLITMSAIVRGTYDLVFGFKHGQAWIPADAHTPEQNGDWALAAGTGTNFMLRLLFDYSGAIYYRMMGGTGDVILAPFYQVLQARGVQFKFFHRVRNLKLDERDALKIAQIEIGRQVKLKNETYQPLYDVKGLPCWPSHPLYDQIDDAQAARLQAERIDLESAWTPWQDEEETVVLQEGRDFDTIIFGLSIGSVPHVCRELIELQPKWRQMVNDVLSVKTMGLQLWMKPTLLELGWTSAPAMLDGFREPLNSWADHADLLPLENWPNDQANRAAPRDMAILCGAMCDEPLNAPPFLDHDFPHHEHERVRQTSVDWLNRYSRFLWPNAVVADGFDWSLLFDARDGNNTAETGEARLNSQFWTANIDPTDRYVLSVPSSTRSRLAPDDSGFANLVLAGDWTLNSLNAGCVEATATSGMLAARAVCGVPEFIYGEE